MPRPLGPDAASASPYAAPGIPYAAPGVPYAAAPHPGYGAAYPVPAAGYAAPAGPPPGRGMAVTALVVSCVSLAITLLVVGLPFLGFLAVMADDDVTMSGALRGQVTGLSRGDRLPGAQLEESIRERLEAEGASVGALSCPDTAVPRASAVVVCRGRVDGTRWTGVVFLEDDEGRYVLEEH